jgi:hypothetical protein
MRALLSLAMIAGLTVFLGIALMRLACFAAEECFLFVHTSRRRRDRWISIIKWIPVKGTVRALPHRFTQVFSYMRSRRSQFTGHRGAFSNARLTRFERGVLGVALHTNGGIPAADDALESPSTQSRAVRRKQSFSGSITLRVAKANRGMLAQKRPTHGQARPAVEKRIRDQYFRS